MFIGSKNLQIIMKKLYLSLVVAIISSINIFAQNTQVATLSHGTNITMFYGGFALQAAYEAAVSGDIISLSGGAFQSVNITKPIVLRGAGIDSDNPTYIINDFDIEIPDNIPAGDTNRLSMEGIRCTGRIDVSNTLCNCYFYKCQFSGSVIFDEASSKRTSHFINCKINEGVSLHENNDALFVNCFIRDGYIEDAIATFMNCVISIYDAYELRNSQFLNCIFDGRDTSYGLPASSVAANCVSVNDVAYMFSDLQQKTNCKKSSCEEVFKTYKGEYSDDETFELTDAAKTTMLGKDGTQIGLYGGLVPYSSTPSYPLITKMNVSNKTTADGKLSVDIEVSAAE